MAANIERNVQQDIDKTLKQLLDSIDKQELSVTESAYRQLLLALTKKLGLEQLKIQSQLKNATTGEVEKLNNEQDQLIKDYHTTIVIITDELDKLIELKK
jgi:hypothetical protein